jgi:hypothetical protein
MLEQVGQKGDEFISVLAKYGGIGLLSAVFIFGGALFLRLNYTIFPELEPWEGLMYKRLCLAAIALSFLVAAVAGMRYSHAPKGSDHLAPRPPNVGVPRP